MQDALLWALSMMGGGPVALSGDSKAGVASPVIGRRDISVETLSLLSHPTTLANLARPEQIEWRRTG
jgi:hypothetical protein